MEKAGNGGHCQLNIRYPAEPGRINFVRRFILTNKIRSIYEKKATISHNTAFNENYIHSNSTDRHFFLFIVCQHN
jgi:hypothetical protein